MGRTLNSSAQGRVLAYSIKFNQQSWDAAQGTYFESDGGHDSLSSMSLPNDDALEPIVQSGWLLVVDKKVSHDIYSHSPRK